MRKTIIILLIAFFAVTLIMGASAYAWRSSVKGFGGYSNNCPVYDSFDPAKTQKFYNDTLPLRQKQYQLRTELMQLYAQPNPDWNEIKKRQQEIVQLRTEIQKRAYEQGLPFGNRMGMHRFHRGW